jgi:hypothetical protein
VRRAAGSGDKQQQQAPQGKDAVALAKPGSARQEGPSWSADVLQVIPHGSPQALSRDWAAVSRDVSSKTSIQYNKKAFFKFTSQGPASGRRTCGAASCIAA